MFQVKADSVKQEFEKQNELKRSSLRVVQALLAIPEAEKSPAMSEFLAQVCDCILFFTFPVQRQWCFAKDAVLYIFGFLSFTRCV